MCSSHSPRADVEQQRAARVDGVGDVLRAARELPREPAVDRAEGEFAAFGPRRAARARCRAARRAWCRRNTDRAAGPCAALTSGSWPSALRRAQASAVRRSCQTIAGATGRPVARSHSTVVSRWLVMPTAATSSTVARARASTSAMVAACVAQISSASCSTQPGAREVLGELALRGRDDCAVVVEQDGARTRRALVEGEHESFHGDLSCRPRDYYSRSAAAVRGDGWRRSQASSRRSPSAGTCSASLLRR